MGFMVGWSMWAACASSQNIPVGCRGCKVKKITAPYTGTGAETGTDTSTVPYSTVIPDFL